MGFASPGPPRATPKADGVATLMTDVRQQWRLPLTEALLCSWQASVIPDSSLRSLERGHYRSHAMEIVSGPIGRERVHYQAPPPEQVPAEMATFLDWYTGVVPLRATRRWRARCVPVLRTPGLR